MVSLPSSHWMLLIRWSRLLSLQDGSQAAVGVLPPLPYNATDLEPYIDNTTTTVHHDKHFNTYVTNLRYLLGNNSQLERFTLAELQRQVGTDLLNGTAATSLKNNGYSVTLCCKNLKVAPVNMAAPLYAT